MSQDRLALAETLALRAGALLREGFGKTMKIGRKGAIDLVSEYDVRSEEIVLSGIRRAFPDDSVLAEESGASGQGEMRWYVDPLDGTSNFVHAFPIFAVSIACARDSQLLLGVIYDPMRDELFSAASGQGARLNRSPVHVSTVGSLSDCLAATSFPYDLRTNPDNNLNRFWAVSQQAHDVRRVGSAAINLAYVASGRLDAYWGMRMSAWDIAAGILLVREAGGRVTRTDGSPDVMAPPVSLLASNGLVHDSMVAVLSV